MTRTTYDSLYSAPESMAAAADLRPTDADNVGHSTQQFADDWSADAPLLSADQMHRHTAVRTAADLWRNYEGIAPVDTIIESAKKIEAYLKGDQS